VEDGLTRLEGPELDLGEGRGGAKGGCIGCVKEVEDDKLGAGCGFEFEKDLVLSN